MRPLLDGAGRLRGRSLAFMGAAISLWAWLALALLTTGTPSLLRDVLLIADFAAALAGAGLCVRSLHLPGSPMRSPRTWGACGLLAWPAFFGFAAAGAARWPLFLMAAATAGLACGILCLRTLPDSTASPRTEWNLWCLLGVASFLAGLLVTCLGFPFLVAFLAGGLGR